MRPYRLAAFALCLVLAGCGSAAAEPVGLNALMTEIEEEIELPEGMEAVTADDLAELYGVGPSQYVQFAGLIASVGVSGDEIVMVEAADDEAVAAVAAGMNERFQAKLSAAEGYLPGEYEKISGGGVYFAGRYAALLVAEDNAALRELFVSGMEGEG